VVQTIKWFFYALASLVVIAIGSPLLFWLGRSGQPPRSEMVVDNDLLADDPGVDVDDES
jgi:hypothetical protein